MNRLFAALLLPAIAIAATGRANVVLIISDDQGYADISCYPHPDEVSTPNLDRLATEGVRMTSGYASCPVCAPTRAGLLTGRYQQRFGFCTAADSRAGLPRFETTLAVLLRNSGYATGVFGKWHVGYKQPYWPLERGFDTFYGFLGHGGHDYFELSRTDAIRSIYRDRERQYGLSNPKHYREAVAFIEANSDHPFFAYVPYNTVHNPVQAPDDYIQRFSNPDRTRNTYLAMLAIMDEGVGEILDTLDRFGLSDDTLVIFFFDNGRARGTTATNGALRNYKHSVYEGGVRVPFLLRWPKRIPSGTVSDEPVISIDAFATILAASGVELPANLIIDSRDILPAVTGALDHPLHEALYWSWINKDSDKGWAVRKGHWKLLTDKGGLELYDLEGDILETHNLASFEPAIVEELLASYRRWQEGLVPRIRRQR